MDADADADVDVDADVDADVNADTSTDAFPLGWNETRRTTDGTSVAISHISYDVIHGGLVATIFDRNDGSELYSITLDDRIAPPPSPSDELDSADDRDPIKIAGWLEQLKTVLCRMTDTMYPSSFNTHDEAQAYRTVLREAARNADTFDLFRRLLFRRKKVVADLDELACCDMLTKGGPNDVRVMRELFLHGACDRPETVQSSLRKSCEYSNESVVTCLLEHWKATLCDKVAGSSDQEQEHKKRVCYLTDLARDMAKRHMFAITLLLIEKGGANLSPDAFLTYMRLSYERRSKLEAVLKAMQDLGRSGDLLKGVSSEMDSFPVYCVDRIDDFSLFDIYGFGETLENPVFLKSAMQSFNDYHILEGYNKLIKFLVGRLFPDRQNVLDRLLVTACGMKNTGVDLVKILTDKGARVSQSDPTDVDCDRPSSIEAIIDTDDINELKQLARSGQSTIITVLTSKYGTFDKIGVLRHLLSLEDISCTTLRDIERVWRRICTKYELLFVILVPSAKICVNMLAKAASDLEQKEVRNVRYDHVPNFSDSSTAPLLSTPDDCSISKSTCVNRLWKSMWKN